ncbi:MAG: hypothetical protein KGI69_03585 [Patescibacteria group bacterium]|nr:hypothetical protein [Patescibacteria group bacterium]
MTLYDKAVKCVDDAFQDKQKRHFERTVYWMEKFYPAYTTAHRIAAYSHDIERGIMKERDRQYLNKDFIRQHEEDRARLMAEFLKKEGADDDIIDKVKHLISRHEEGGDEEQNALKDADSVSYFETNAEMFVRKRAEQDGYEKVKGKLDWMFDRITSSAAKDAARANYEKWRKELDVAFKH